MVVFLTRFCSNKKDINTPFPPPRILRERSPRFAVVRNKTMCAQEKYIFDYSMINLVYILIQFSVGLPSIYIYFACSSQNKM